MTLAPSSVAAQDPAPFALDEFGRVVKDGWGATTPGGQYILEGNPTDFGVNATGTIALPRKQRSVFLPDVTALNLASSVRVKVDKRATGGPQFIFLTVRRMPGGDSYVARLRVRPNGKLSVRPGTLIDGQVTLLGRETRVPNLKLIPDHFIFLKVQATGTNPTFLSIRAWAYGSPEPPGWHSSMSDATPGLQQAGAVGVRVSAKAGVNNWPFRFDFDDFRASAIDGGSGPPPPPPATPPSGDLIYWGAYVKGDTYGLASDPPWDWKAVDLFEQHAGKRMSILHFGQPWYHAGAYQSFPTGAMERIRTRGYIPLLMWGSWDYCCGPSQPQFKLSTITSGAHDAYLVQWARDAKAWGKPFFLGLDVEMNGWWHYPWSEDLNGNQKGDFVKMWRHVHAIFEMEGATNVTWVWNPNVVVPASRPLSRWYPGHEYVDWVAADGYNWGSAGGKQWQSFAEVFGYTYDQLQILAPAKPVMIGQFASSEHGGNKANWITDALTEQLPQAFPEIKAVLWFNWNAGDPSLTWPIESSAAAQNAFANGIRSSYYSDGNYSDLNISPIPPP
jgi:hypothetical protein